MKQTKEYLKQRFETGDIPTGEDFANLIDSTYNDIESADIETALSKKVDKVSGKGLSSNDYTGGDKSTLLTLMSLFNVDTTVNSALNMGVLTWNGSSNANAYISKGTYRIKGERLSTEDNLPIQNTGSGHTIDGMLYVLDASLTNGTGETDDITITQLLVLSNRVGGQQGGMWMRSAYGHNKNYLTWKQWEKMQINMEVGIVSDDYQYNTQGQQIGSTYAMNYLVDNGIYSGVYVPSGATLTDTSVETFVMVCVNNYAYSTVQGWYPELTQIRMGITGGGEFIMQRRIAGRSTEPGAKWEFAQWVDLTKDSRIGEGAIIGKNALIGENAQLGENTDYYPNVPSEEHVMSVIDSPHLQSRVGFYTNIGKNVNIGEGVTIPSDTNITPTSIDNFDDLWVAAGGAIDATNTEAPYTLNGLNLTYNEALVVYNESAGGYNATTLYNNRTLYGRTNFVNAHDRVGYSFGWFNAPNAEVLNFKRTVALSLAQFLSEQTHYSLKQILGSIAITSTNIPVTIFDCPNLELLKIALLNADINLSKCPKLNFESWEYLVNSANNKTKAISVKVHADVYAKLTGDTTNEAAAALSAEELAKWTTLYTTAAKEKSISFGV